MVFKLKTCSVILLLHLFTMGTMTYGMEVGEIRFHICSIRKSEKMHIGGSWVEGVIFTQFSGFFNISKIVS